MKPLLIIGLVVCGLIGVAAQERVIGEQEFNAAVKNSERHSVAWSGKAYRRTTVSTAQAEGRPETDYSSRMVFEYGPAKERRTIFSSTFGGKPKGPDTSLLIGQWLYSRSGEGPWTRKEVQPGAKSDDVKTAGNDQVTVLSVEYRFLGEQAFKGRNARVYMRTEKSKRTSGSSGETFESESVSKYWIDAEGLLLREEYRGQSRSERLKSMATVISEWELDPTIEFKVPVVP